jgi:hypothetical protein
MSTFIYCMYIILKLIATIFVISFIFMNILYSTSLYLYPHPFLDFIIKEITMDRVIIFYETLAILFFVLSFTMTYVIVRERRYSKLCSRRQNNLHLVMESKTE